MNEMSRWKVESKVVYLFVFSQIPMMTKNKLNFEKKKFY